MSFKNLNAKTKKTIEPFILATSGYSTGKKFDLWILDLKRRFVFTGHKILWELETIETYFTEIAFVPTKRSPNPPVWILTLEFEQKFPVTLNGLTHKPDKDAPAELPLKKVFNPKTIPELIDGLKDLGVHDFFTIREIGKDKGAKEEATLRVVARVVGVLEGFEKGRTNNANI